MKLKVLVAFSSSHGSTAGIAERIGETLASRGAAVEVCAVSDAPSLESFEAFVVGSAINDARWLPDALTFMEANAPAIGRRPVWLFSVSSVGDDGSFFSDRVSRLLRKMQKEPVDVGTLRGLVRVQGHRAFAGAIARGDWSRTGRAFMRVLGGHYGDHRNWPAIEEWARRIDLEMAALVAEPAAPAPLKGDRGLTTGAR